MPEENPFLERFYFDPRRNACHPAISFYFQRHAKISRYYVKMIYLSNVRVADFLNR